jgi:hypothetical protein
VQDLAVNREREIGRGDGLEVCVLSNSYVSILTLKEMGLGGKALAFGK